MVFKKRASSWTTFEKVEVTLNAGETETVTFTTKGDTRLDASGSSIVVPGVYTVDINGKAGQFTVTVPPPTSEELEANQIIEDLAYIKASFVLPYSDDADPEYEGISISVSYYDSKSEEITPNGVSVEVTVELYWYTDSLPIYNKKFIVEYPAYSSLSISLPKEVVRIPFEGIQKRPSGMSKYQGPILILTVKTPNQGNFKDQETISLIWP